MFNKTVIYQTNLERKNPLDIYCFYLGELLNSSPFSSPFRNDSTPSCRLDWYAGKLRYVDFGGNYLNIDVINFLKLVYQCDNYLELAYEELFLGIDHSDKRVISKYNASKNPITTISNHNIEIIVEKRNWEVYDKEFWKLPTNYLEYHNVLPVNRVAYINSDDRLEYQSNLYSSPKSPTYAYYYDYRKYKIYRPYEIENKWRSNITKDTLDITSYDYKEYILCTSKKDRIITQYVLDNYIDSSIGTCNYQSEVYLPENININIIGLIADNDLPGINYASRIGLPYITLSNKDPFEVFIKQGIKKLTNELKDGINKFREITR